MRQHDNPDRETTRALNEGLWWTVFGAVSDVAGVHPARAAIDLRVEDGAILGEAAAIAR